MSTRCKVDVLSRLRSVVRAISFSPDSKISSLASACLSCFLLLIGSATALHADTNAGKFKGKTTSVEMAAYPNGGEILTATVLLDGNPPENPPDFGGHAGGYCFGNGEKITDHFSRQLGETYEKLAVRLSWVKSVAGPLTEKQHWIWVFEMPGCKLMN